jgi:hypothetical protein
MSVVGYAILLFLQPFFSDERGFGKIAFFFLSETNSSTKRITPMTARAPPVRIAEPAGGKI